MYAVSQAGRAGPGGPPTHPHRGTRCHYWASIGLAPVPHESLARRANIKSPAHTSFWCLKAREGKSTFARQVRHTRVAVLIYLPPPIVVSWHESNVTGRAHLARPAKPCYHHHHHVAHRRYSAAAQRSVLATQNTNHHRRNCFWRPSNPQPQPCTAYTEGKVAHAPARARCSAAAARRIATRCVRARMVEQREARRCRARRKKVDWAGGGGATPCSTLH